LRRQEEIENNVYNLLGSSIHSTFVSNSGSKFPHFFVGNIIIVARRRPDNEQGDLSKYIRPLLCSTIKESEDNTDDEESEDEE
jgi:hypothetical protein